MLVVRAGFGITYEPYNFWRDLRGDYPTQYAQNLTSPDTRAWTTTLEQGLPALPNPPQGDRLPMPLDAALITADPSFHKGYVESWNLTLEKQLGAWIASAGYVANRSVRQLSYLDANYALPGTGQQGQLLVQRFQRTANTQILGDLGMPKYDSLQARLSRRFQGYSVQVAYTYANSRAFASESSSSTPRIAIPAYWQLNYGPATQDLRHVVALSSVAEFPFGRGKRWVNDGLAAAILGGWQASTVASLHTGFPVSATAPATVLNAPGNANTADCLGSVDTIGRPTAWWSRANLADPNVVSPRTPRFGTCGVGILRGPGLINVDVGVARKFRISERFGLQFRADAMNLSNTPHFANPTGDVTNANFGVVTTVQNTGRAGIDQRLIRLGLRLGW